MLARYGESQFCMSVTCMLSDETKLKLKTNLYNAIKSEDSDTFDGGTSQLSSRREHGKIKMF